MYSECYEVLCSLARLASSSGSGEHKYEIVDFAFGFIPFKDDVNEYANIGGDFVTIARWLLTEIENNQI